MQPLTFSIPSFCAAFNVGRTTLYRMWREGEGPDVMRLRRRVVISAQAADAWRRRVEAASNPSSEAAQHETDDAEKAVA